MLDVCIIKNWSKQILRTKVIGGVQIVRDLKRCFFFTKEVVDHIGQTMACVVFELYRVGSVKRVSACDENDVDFCFVRANVMFELLPLMLNVESLS
jgi:hypothetical protein